MATVTAAVFSRWRDLVYRSGGGKEEIKALPSVPDQPHQLAALQAIEDGMVANFGTLKSGSDTALGVTTSTALFTKMLAAYCILRGAGEL
jgi:hypothetical protein